MWNPVCKQHGLDNPADLLASGANSLIPTKIVMTWTISDIIDMAVSPQ